MTAHTIHLKDTSYADLKRRLGQRQSRKIANNTRLAFDFQGNIVLVYHTSEIVVWYPDGRVRFSDCGWQTLSTKERLNWCLPSGWYLYSKRGDWILSCPEQPTQASLFESKPIRKEIVFYNGLTILDGRILSEGQLKEAA